MPSAAGSRNLGGQMDPEEDNYIDEPFANYEEDFEQITDSTL